MRATTRFLLLGAFAMCLSACLPEPPMGSDAAIFKRPSRYGWGAAGRRPGSSSQVQAEQPKPRSSGNRFGHSDNKPKPNSGSSSSSSNNSNSRAADSGPSSNSSNRPDDSGSSSRDQDDDKKKEMADSGSSGSNSGSNSSSSSDKKSESSSSTPPSNLNSYPYARLVPGKKGFVTLPGANAGVGEIDVTGIKPGTPVEINDPRDTSKKIYFRVP